MTEKEVILEQFWKLQPEEKKVVLDFLREVWDFYDENYSFAALGTSDERVEFLQEVFLNPLVEAMDAVAVEINSETSKQRLQRKLQEIADKRSSLEHGKKKDIEDPLPF